MTLKIISTMLNLSTLWAIKNETRLFFVITLANIDRFS